MAATEKSLISEVLPGNSLDSIREFIKRASEKDLFELDAAISDENRARETHARRVSAWEKGYFNSPLYRAYNADWHPRFHPSEMLRDNQDVLDVYLTDEEVNEMDTLKIDSEDK